MEKSVVSSSILKGALGFIEGSGLTSCNLHMTSSFVVNLGDSLWVYGVPKGMWYVHLLSGVSFWFWLRGGCSRGSLFWPGTSICQLLSCIIRGGMFSTIQNIFFK